MTSSAESRAASRFAWGRRRSSDIILLDESDLLRLFTALQNSRQRGVLSTVGLSLAQAAQLRAELCRPRSLRRPLHPLLDRAATIHRLFVGDYRSKDSAVHRIGNWAAECGLNSRGIAALEQAADELLLNALFDAPHDANGRPRYVGLSPRQRVSSKMLPGEQAEVLYASDKRRVIVSVRDCFGALRRATVLNYLIRCAADQNARRSPLEAKAGGSGVGLSLIAGAASELFFRLRRGQLTEVSYVIYYERARPLRALLIDDDITSSVAGPTL